MPFAFRSKLLGELAISMWLCCLLAADLLPDLLNLHLPVSVPSNSTTVKQNLTLQRLMSPVVHVFATHRDCSQLTLFPQVPRQCGLSGSCTPDSHRSLKSGR